MNQKTQILLVDDEPEVLRSLQRLLRRNGFDVEVASDGEAALQSLGEKESDVIISDFKMPGMSGAELLASVAARFPGVRRVLLSGCADLAFDFDALFLPKPYDQDQILSACKQGRLP